MSELPATVAARPAPSGWRAVGLWCAAYLAAGFATIGLQHGPGASLWYPPIAIGIAWLYRTGVRNWPWILACELVIAWFQYGPHPGRAVLVAACATLESALAVWFFARTGFDASFRSGARIPLMSGLAVAAATLVGATLGSALQLVLFGGAGAGTQGWLTWWLGDTFSVLTLLPALVIPPACGDAEAPSGPPGTAFERVLLLLVAASLGLTHLGGESSTWGPVVSRGMFDLVPVAWAATRFDRRTTAWAVAALGIASLIAFRFAPTGEPATLLRLSPHFLVIQADLALTAIVGLTIAHLIERDRSARATLQRLARESALREAHLSLAQQVGRTGSWEVDLRSGARRWSSSMYEIFGFDPAQGVPALEAYIGRFAPEMRDEIARRVDAIHRGEAVPEMLVRANLPAGGERWLSMRSQRVDGEDGSRIIGLCSDVTELIRRSEASNKLATILSSSTDAVLTVRPDGTLSTWNLAARLFGFDPEEPPGRRRFDDFVPEPRRAAKAEHIHRAFQGERVRAEHAQLRRTDGSQLPARITFSPVLDLRNRIAEVAIMCGDLTEQQGLEQQLLHAQKMEAVGRLTGGIAHDFNNMLTAILGFSELARSRFEPDSEVEQEIGQVVLAAERASALTQRLLAFSRRQPPAPQRVELDSLLRRLAPMLQRLVGEDLAVGLRLEARDAQVNLDPTQMEQVLLNLLVNARDAMPRGGQVSIESSRAFVDDELHAREPDLPRGTAVVLSVSDSGVGMDAPTRARIFEPFFTTKEPGRGTGLGLATVLAIVRDNQGAIRVQSEPGVGSTFRLYFPEATEPGVLTASGNDLALAPPRGSETLLVAEDEPIVRDFLAACLRGAGYRVLLAEAGDPATIAEATHGERFDMLVTDIVMPRATGIDLANRLRLERPELPVLFLSGYSTALFDGPLPGELLPKPFARDALLYAVHRVLRREATFPRG